MVSLSFSLVRFTIKVFCDFCKIYIFYSPGLLRNFFKEVVNFTAFSVFHMRVFSTNLSFMFPLGYPLMTYKRNF